MLLNIYFQFYTSTKDFFFEQVDLLDFFNTFFLLFTAITVCCTRYMSTTSTSRRPYHPVTWMRNITADLRTNRASADFSLITTLFGGVYSVVRDANGVKKLRARTLPMYTYFPSITRAVPKTYMISGVYRLGPGLRIPAYRTKILFLKDNTSPIM